MNGYTLPVSKHGSNDIENIQPLCRKCNGWKGARTMDFRSNPFSFAA